MARNFVVFHLVFLAVSIIHSNGHSSEEYGLKPICNGCIRYVKGFDITGVTNTVVFTVKTSSVKTACDCVNKCRQNSNTCANFVWKYTDGSGYRTCTLYSNFNLPSDVTIAVNVSGSKNVGVIADNPQEGGLVPHCQRFDSYGNVIGIDYDCISGPVWALDNNKLLC